MYLSVDLDRGEWLDCVSDRIEEMIEAAVEKAEHEIENLMSSLELPEFPVSAIDSYKTFCVNLAAEGLQ